VFVAGPEQPLWQDRITPPDLKAAISTLKGIFALCPDAKGLPNVFIISPLFFQ
jgi:hypothetical protein